MPVIRYDLVCEVVSLRYDFETRSGTLTIPLHQSTDLSGCVNLFLAIDPNVERIAVFTADRPDTIYLRDGDDWVMVSMRRHYPGDFAPLDESVE